MLKTVFTVGIYNSALFVDSTTVEGTGAALTDAGTPAELGRWPRQTVFSDGDMGETGMH
jgi:hypothetical protein